MMYQKEQLLALVEDIYDASFDPEHWRETLRRIIKFAGAQSCGLITIGTGGNIQIGYSVGVEPEFMESYVESYAQFDPLPAVQYAPVGKILTTADWLPIEDFRKGMFYQEWARPQGLEDGVNSLIDKSASGFSYFGLMRAGGLVDDEMRDRFSSLIPHLRRAILVGQKLEQQTAIETSAMQALDALRSALFLLDRAGRVTHANASARELLQHNDFLRSVQGRLTASDSRVNRILRQAIATSALGDGLAPNESITLPFITREGSRYIGHLMPLTAGRRRNIATAYDATAMLFVDKASLDVTTAPGIIHKVFKLTPAEVRVLLSIVEIGGVPDVARSLDVAESTVKTHLNNIFTKTDTKRQADLVRLVAAFTPPTRA